MIAGPSPQGQPLRFHFLDGIRGVAALYVVMHHAYVHARDRASLTDALPPGAGIFAYGHVSVVVFIVLSGFCLMLPLTRSSDGRMANPTAYLGRRARRILPPYYAALLMAVLMLLVARRFGVGVTGAGDDLALAPLLSHLLLVHNLDDDWIVRINGPLWSVATEWQIYFLFPLLLLPLRRRFGNLAAVLAGFSFTLIPLAAASRPLYEACPWFVGCFAFGMTGAVFGVSALDGRDAARSAKRWGTAAMLSLTAMLAIGALWPAYFEHSMEWAADPLVAMTAMCALVHATASPTSIVRRLFEHRWFTVLGGFSYSLYVVHGPLVAAMDTVLARWTTLGIPAALLLMLLVGVPAIVAFAYVFSLAFERPFMRRAGHASDAPSRVAATAARNVA